QLGCYLGFASSWRLLLSSSNDEKQSKKVKTLDSLLKMIQTFPTDDATNERLQEELARIRGKVKQVCSLLNVQPDFGMRHDGPGLSF
ncbi:hypothetical protein GDO81_027847, partial [Engystomops pustulosus]